MEGSDSEHRPRRPRKPKRKPALPRTGGILCFPITLAGGPYDGLRMMVAIPLPNEIDISQYVGGTTAKKHWYKRGRASPSFCEYQWNRSDDLMMFESGGQDGPA